MMKTEKPTQIVMILAVCLLMAACGSSKSLNDGGSAPTTTTTLPVSKAPELPPVVDPNGSAADREKNDTDEQDNSGSGTVINAPTQQEIETMQKEASRYSGSSDDGLRELLLSGIDQETDQVQKAKNLKFAFNIISAELKPTPKGSKIQLILKMVDTSKEKIGSKKLTYSGLLSLQKKTNRIELQGRDKDGKNIEKLKGKLICLDETRPRMLDCQTKLAEVYLDKAMVQIILRRAPVYAHGEFGNRQCVTEACENMYGLLRNTQDETKDGNSILQASMETFEIIQGRSAFNILMISRAGEILKFAGPLPDKEQYAETLDTGLNRKLTSDERVDPVTKLVRKTKLNDSLGYAALQSNDEKGQLKVKVSTPFIDKDETLTRDKFELIFTRELRPLRAFIDERSKTSSSK